MRTLFALLCVILAVPAAPSVGASTIELDFHSAYPPTYRSRFPIDFSWIIERYDFDRIEEYIDEYYISYYKYYEKYLVSKQKELAGKFGLSDIFLKPDFRRYEKTRIVLSKKLWNGRILLRYLAPLGDVRDFELFIALKPVRFVTFILRGKINDGRSAVLVINRPLGGNGDEDATRRFRLLLNQARRLMRPSCPSR